MEREIAAIQNAMNGSNYYGLFLRFFDKYAPAGFKDIDPADPLLVDLEDIMEKTDQFFYIGALTNMEIIYVSKRSAQMMGIAPEDLRPNHFYQAGQPDDKLRGSLGRIRLFKMGYDLSLLKSGYSLMSSNYRIRNAQGNFANMLMQLLVLYCNLPYESIFLIKVHTNIDWCGKLKYGYHFYTGNDLSYFRYPDEDLLKVGVPFSNREMEIIHLIGSGLNSYQIAEKLFISPQTVFTHRRNILKKSGKTTLSDVIFDLKDRGVL